MKNILKILGKIVLFIIILLIVLVTIMKLFFPIYKINPLDNQDGIIINANYVLTQKYFDENNLKETDFIIYQNILGSNYLLLPYRKNTFLKYKNNIVGKVIYKFN